MGLFWRDKTVKGISEYELNHDHIQSHMDSVFPSHLSSSKQKRAALHAVLGLAGDRDTNMHTSQKYGVIQREEFETAIHSLEKGGILSAKEVAKLKQIAEKPLND